MPVTLRRRLQCHGCGSSLAVATQKPRTTSRETKLQCDTCLAENYFDQNWNPIDVPVEEAAQPRYSAAHAPEIESTSTSFCKTCLKNQFLYVTALGEYLPDDDHPSYAELEANLPTFKKELELRYPQCCAQCEPRVSSSVEHANYNAKTDHLRRVMAKRRSRQSMGHFNIRSVIIKAAGTGYALSLAVQLLWHTLAAQAILEDRISDDQHLTTPAMSLSACIRQWPVPVSCATSIKILIPWSLLVALLCIWWNPYWQQRFKGREGRLTGLRRYYLLQVSVLAIRFAAWIVASDISDSASYVQSLHAVAAALTTMLSLYAQFAAIVIDNTPLVDWAQVQRPLTHPDQFPSHASNSYQNTPPHSQSGSQVSMTDFAGTANSVPEAWRPPTPPGSTDAMEWTSSTHDFDPRPRMPRQRFEQPTPFYGNLPAAPARGSLHPKRQPPPPPKQALGIAPGFFGLSKPQNPAQSSPPSYSQPVFAPTKFFAAERDADTGLENIFDKMFSVKDPLEQTPARGKSRNQTRTPHTSQGAIKRPVAMFDSAGLSHTTSLSTFKTLWNCFTVLGLLTLASNISWVEFQSSSASPQPTDLLPYTFIIPCAHLIEDVLISGSPTAGQIVVSLLSLSIPVLGYLLHPSPTSPFAPSWNKVAIGLLLLLMLHEIYDLCQAQTRPVSRATEAQMIESMRAAEAHVFGEVAVSSHPSPPTTYAQPLAPTSELQHSWLRPSSQTAQPQRYPPPSDARDVFGGYSPVRKRDSNESISSVSSIQTTSTAAGWKTPKNESRTFDFQDSQNSFSSRRPSNNLSRGLGGLSLSNDFGIGTGFGVAGPRSTRQQETTFGRYR